MKPQTVLLFTLLLLIGCKTAQPPQTAVPVPQPAPAATTPKTLYADGRKNNATTPQQPAAATQSEAQPLLTQPFPIQFSLMESADIRRIGINPLPGGVLIVDLDRAAAEYCPPLLGKFLSPFGPRSGRMHTGIDIKAAPCDTIRAAFAGVVRMDKPYSGYGNLVVIRHYLGFETVYAHNTRNLVKVNDVVAAGQPIALAGRTGRATTEHLHFELRAAGEPLDPAFLVDPNTMQLRPGTLTLRAEGDKIIAENSSMAGKTDSPLLTTSNRTTNVGSTSGLAYHTVTKGDTLYSIARRNGTTVAALCRLNNIKETSVLSLGQKIKLK